MKYILKTEEDTENLAKEIASRIKGGETIGLVGDLGAGKTTFSKYLAKALGVESHVNSPTFVIMKVYETHGHGIRYVAHMDAYRLSNSNQLSEIGLDVYLNNPDSVVIIEWAEKIKEALPKNTIWIEFKIVGEEREVWVGGLEEGELIG